MPLHHYLSRWGLIVATFLLTAYGRHIPIDDPRCSEFFKNLWRQNPHNTTIFYSGGGYPGEGKIKLDELIKQCGSEPSRYPMDDIYSRVAGWCVPLFILIGTYQFAALGLWNALFVAVHMLTDPFNTLFCLLAKLANDRSRRIKCLRELNRSGQVHRVAAILLSASEELEQCVKAALPGSCACNPRPKGLCDCISLADPNPVGGSIDILIQVLTPSNGTPSSVTDDRVKVCIAAAKELIDSRANGVWKTSLGALNYIAAVILAFLRTSRDPVKNRTGHTIAFAMLYTWIIPSVLLSALVGEFVTKRSARRILMRLQEQLNLIAQKADQSTVELFHFGDLSESELEQLLKWCGGNYAFRPYQRCWNREMIILRIVSIFPVLTATLCAVMISYTSPTKGLGCRSLLQLLFFATWVISSLLTEIFTRVTNGLKLWRWIQIKALVVFAPQCLVYLAAFGGLLNSPRCWSGQLRPGRGHYVLVDMTLVIKALAKFTWPMIAMFVLGAQLGLVVAILLVYRKGRLYGELDEDLGEQC